MAAGQAAGGADGRPCVAACGKKSAQSAPLARSLRSGALAPIKRRLIRTPIGVLGFFRGRMPQSGHVKWPLTRGYGFFQRVISGVPGCGRVALRRCRLCVGCDEGLVQQACEKGVLRCFQALFWGVSWLGRWLRRRPAFWGCAAHSALVPPGWFLQGPWPRHWGGRRSASCPSDG